MGIVLVQRGRDVMGASGSPKWIPLSRGVLISRKGTAIAKPTPWHEIRAFVPARPRSSRRGGINLVPQTSAALAEVSALR